MLSDHRIFDKFRTGAGVFSIAVLFLFGAFAAIAGEITLQYNFGYPAIEQVQIDKTVYHRITLSDSPRGGQPGHPALPSRGARILIPGGEDVESVEIIPGEKILVGRDYVIEPVGTPMALSANPSEVRMPTPDESVYALDIPYPASRHEQIGVQSFRGYQILILRLNPVEYLPATGELWYYPSLEVVVTTSPAEKNFPLFRGLPKDDAEISSRVDNPEARFSYAAGQKSGNENFDLMILTVPGLESAFQPLKDYHDSTGIATEIFTVADVGSFAPEDIRNFIIEKYLNDGIEYVLLGDDDNLIAARDMYIQAWVYDQGAYTDYHMPSDLYYACLDGSYDYNSNGLYGEPTDGEGGGDVDLIAEVYVGRAAVDNADDVNRFVDKTIQYLSSTHPYLQKVLISSEDLNYPDEKHYGYVQMEELIDGASTHGYTTVGIPSDLYSVDKLCDYYWPGDWLPDDMMDRIESGVQIVNHLGHSFYEYAMRLTPIDALVLGNPEPCFMYTQGCYAGGFDTLGAECMAEMLTVKAVHGAFAAIMNARYGWVEVGAHPNTHDGANQRYHREFWDAVFNPDEDKPQIGRANQDSKEDNIYRINDGAMRWVYYQLNLFGDPSVAIKRPTGLSFAFPEGTPSTTLPGQETSFAVIVSGLYGGDPVPGSGQLHYCLNGGDVQVMVMTETILNNYVAVLPVIGCEDTLAYYISVEEATTGRLYDPPPDSAHVLMPVENNVTVFEDDFETENGWSVSGGSWARGIPSGGGGEKGWPDPTSGYGAPGVFGYNLSGDYESNLGAMHLTSPTIDCADLGNVHLVFYRWLGVEHIPWDHASMGISADGVNWATLWENTGLVQDSEWTEIKYDISQYAAYQPAVYLRWTMGPTNHVFHYCGWNIDDISVFGYECFEYECGDANGDEIFNIGDAVFIVTYVFRSGPAPEPLESGDANADGETNVGDAVYMISHIFKGGPEPQCP
jgi:hypothetical protein